MRFDGKRQVSAGREALWQALHDPHVLREIVTGCESMTHLDGGTFAATMVARVGPMADTYRGTFTIVDLREGEELRVRVGARGRCGRLDLDLRVTLADGARLGTTALTYVAEAKVGGWCPGSPGPRCGSSATTSPGASSAVSRAPWPHLVAPSSPPEPTGGRKAEPDRQ